MKLSELIKQGQEKLETHGDVEVVMMTQQEDWEPVEELRFDAVWITSQSREISAVSIQ